MNNSIKKYIELVKEHNNYYSQGNDKKANKIHKQITKLVSKIQKDSDETKEQFFELLEHSDTSVKTWTAAELLGTFENKSINVLESLVTDITKPSHAILDLWKQGILKKESWK